MNPSALEVPKGGGPVFTHTRAIGQAVISQKCTRQFLRSIFQGLLEYSLPTRAAIVGTQLPKGKHRAGFGPQASVSFTMLSHPPPTLS